MTDRTLNTIQVFFLIWKRQWHLSSTNIHFELLFHSIYGWSPIKQILVSNFGGVACVQYRNNTQSANLKTQFSKTNVKRSVSIVSTKCALRYSQGSFEMSFSDNWRNARNILSYCLKINRIFDTLCFGRFFVCAGDWMKSALSEEGKFCFKNSNSRLLSWSFILISTGKRLLRILTVNKVFKLERLGYSRHENL